MHKFNQMIDASKRRLVIKQLEMINFKSYYGKVVIKPDYNFSFIIGQNGTGKSNFFDAILFLMGRQGNQIRSHKLADLIYRDAEQKIDTAQVIAHFMSLNIPEGEEEDQQNLPFTIKRWVRKKYNQSGGVVSGYELNGRPQKIQNIKPFLYKRGMDMNIRHNIIIQHQISEYAMLRPKGSNPKEMGFCQIFERAIGIDHRNETKKQLQKEVRQLEQVECENLGIIEMHKKSLKKLEPLLKNDLNDNKEARQINLLRYLLFSFSYLEVSKQHSQIQKNFMKLNEEILKIQEEKKKKNEETNEMIAELNKLIKVNDDLEARHKKFLYNINKKKQSVEQSGSQINELDVEHKKSIEKLQTLQQNFETMKQEEKDQKKQFELLHLKKEIQDSKNHLQRQEALRNKQEKVIIQKKEPITRKIRAIENQINPMLNDIARAQDIVKQNFQQMEALHRNLQYEEKDYRKLQEDHQRMKQKIDHLIAQKSRVIELRNQIERSLLPLTRDSKKQSDILLPRQQELNQLNQRYKDLRQMEKSQTNGVREQEDQIVKLVHRDGRIPTFMGRLDSLGNINQKYHDAALAAAGKTLFSYVVQTREDMKRFMKLCKENKIRAGILCYEVILERNQNLANLNISKVHRDGKEIPRIINLIKAKNKTASFLFKFCFRSTLIAQDFDTAHLIAYKGKQRQRVVTMNGDLLQINGTVKTVPKGAYSYQHTFLTQVKKKVSEEEIKSILGDIQNCEAECNQRQAYINNYSREIYRLKSKMPQNGVENKIDWDIKGLNQELGLLEKEMEQQRQNQEKIRRIKRDIQNCRLQNEQIRRGIQQKQNELAPLQRQKENLLNQQEKLQGEQFNQILNEIQRLRKQIQQLAKQKIHVAEQIKFAEANFQNLQGQIKEVENQIKKQRVKIVKLKEGQDVKCKQLEQMYDQMAQLDKEIQITQRTKQELKEEIVRKRSEAQQNSEYQEDLRVALAQQQIKVQTIKKEKAEKKRDVGIYKEKNAEILSRRKRLFMLQKKNQESEMYLASVKQLKHHVNIEYLSKGQGIGREELEKISSEFFQKSRNKSQRIKKDDYQDDQDDDEQDDDDDQDDEQDEQDDQDGDNFRLDDDFRFQSMSQTEDNDQLVEARRFLHKMLQRQRGVELANRENLEMLIKLRQNIKRGLNVKVQKAIQRKKQLKRQQKQERFQKKIASSRKKVGGSQRDSKIILDSDQDDDDQEDQNSNQEISYFHAYQKKAKEYFFTLNHYRQSLHQRILKHSHYHDFNTQIRQRFDKALPQIQRKIAAVYKQMTNGQLHIQPINQYGYDLQGLQIHVKPPFSVWINRQFLSGGQKTMIALSVVLGLHLFRPSPFFLFDEVDASLDSSNVQTLTRFVGRIKNSQFFMISHREQGAQFAPYFILVKPIKVTQKHFGVNIDHLSYEEALDLKRNYLNNSNYKNKQNSIKERDLQFIAISGRRNRLLKRDEVLNQYIQQFGFVNGYDKFLMDEAKEQQEEQRMLQRIDPLLENYEEKKVQIRYSVQDKHGVKFNVENKDIQKFIANQRKQQNVSKYVIEDDQYEEASDEIDEQQSFDENLFENLTSSKRQNRGINSSIVKQITTLNNRFKSQVKSDRENQQLKEARKMVKANYNIYDQQEFLQDDENIKEVGKSKRKAHKKALASRYNQYEEEEDDYYVDYDDDDDDQERQKENKRQSKYNLDNDQQQEQDDNKFQSNKKNDNNGYKIILDEESDGDDDDDDDNTPYYSNQQKGVTFELNQADDDDDDN